MLFRSCADKDSRISVLTIPHCGLPAKVRNLGIREARGRFVAFCDSDDLWVSEKLELQLHALEKQPQAVLVCSQEIGRASCRERV